MYIRSEILGPDEERAVVPLHPSQWSSLGAKGIPCGHRLFSGHICEKVQKIEYVWLLEIVVNHF